MKLSEVKERFLSLFRAERPGTSKATREAPDIVSPEKKPGLVKIIIGGPGELKETFIHDPHAYPVGTPTLDPEATFFEREEMREPEISAYELNDRLLDAALTHWNGMSLRDIPEKMFHDHDHHETHPKLQATVPEPYRKAVWQAQDNESPNRRHSIQILAIDSQGDALVKRYVVDDYLDADGSSYNVETKESAIASVAEYQNSHLKKELSLGSMDLGDAMAGKVREHALEDDVWLDSIEVEIVHPVQGQTYRGPIVTVHGSTAYQDIGNSTHVAHETGSLVGMKENHLVGMNVEIRYPCGLVGLARNCAEHGAEVTGLLPMRTESNIGDRER